MDNDNHKDPEVKNQETIVSNDDPDKIFEENSLEKSRSAEKEGTPLRDEIEHSKPEWDYINEEPLIIKSECEQSFAQKEITSSNDNNNNRESEHTSVKEETVEDFTSENKSANNDESITTNCKDGSKEMTSNNLKSSETLQAPRDLEKKQDTFSPKTEKEKTPVPRETTPNDCQPETTLVKVEPVDDSTNETNSTPTVNEDDAILTLTSTLSSEASEVSKMDNSTELEKKQVPTRSKNQVKHSSDRREITPSSNKRPAEQAFIKEALKPNHNESLMSLPKRTRFDEELDEIRLLIPSNIAGAIIGKGGQNIQKLRTDYNAKVNIVDCRGPERVITIGTNISTICKIISEILKQFDQVNGNEYDLRILIHQSMAGCVIGKGGVKIKEIKEEIGCQLKVFPESTPQSNNRVVQIIGNEAQCIFTIQTIFEIMKRTPMRGAIRNYDPSNFNEYSAANYGGYSHQRPSINVVPRSNRPSDIRFNDRVTVATRNNRSIDRGRPINPWVSNGGSSSWLHNSSGYQPYANNDGAYRNISGETTSTQVSIPNDITGALIGKKGERIRRI